MRQEEEDGKEGGKERTLGSRLHMCFFPQCLKRQDRLRKREQDSKEILGTHTTSREREPVPYGHTEFEPNARVYSQQKSEKKD